MALAALELTPPLVRNSLLQQSEFRGEYGLEVEAGVAFGNTGVSILRSEIFDAMREILSGMSEIEVIDSNGREWVLRYANESGNPPTFVISSGKQRFVLPHFASLSPNRTSRLRSLDEVVSDVNLPANVQEQWRSVLLDHALGDDEVDELRIDFCDTPVHVTRLIRNEIVKGESSVSSLIPHSRRYFERLVGAYDGSASIKDYAAGTGREFFKQLSRWRPYDGFLFSLLLSSHSALTAEISVEQLENEDLVRAFDFLEEHGDKISQLGAIEVGLRVLPERPAIEPSIIRLIKQIRDDSDAPASGFTVLSALFILVDGELSRTRLLAADPPFYRRLASLSQAALILRELLHAGIDLKTFGEWAFNNRSEQYYMQSLVDMRLEPRWNPDLADEVQVKADFFGRIMIAARNYQKNINRGELHDLTLGTGRGSIHSLSEFPRPYFPGPLEGAENSPNTLPAELSTAIEAQLSTENVETSSFIALVNSAMIFRLGSAQAELAANSLKLGSYRLANVENKFQLLAILNGLATVAAVTRSGVLAGELRILVRRYRRDPQYSLSIDEAMRICLVSAASQADLNGWREFSGDWLTELAFGDLDGDEGQVLLSRLRCLCHAAPELWVSTGRADAALMAHNASRHPS